MMSSKGRSRIADNLLLPVKSSMKSISRGGVKVWESLVGRTPFDRNNRLSKSLVEFPKHDEYNASDTEFFHSKREVLTSITEEHYACVSSVQLRKSAEQNSGQRNSPRSPGRETLSFEKFKNVFSSSTPKQKRKFRKFAGVLESIGKRRVSNDEEFDDSEVDDNAKPAQEIDWKQEPIQEGKKKISRINRCISELQIYRHIDRSSLQDIYEEENPCLKYSCADRWKQVIQEKIVVRLNESPKRKKSPMSTPICKSTSRIESTELPVSPLARQASLDSSNLFDASSVQYPFFCGSNDDLNISFSSSHGSDDSISELLSEDEGIVEVCSWEKSDTHFETFDFLRGKKNEQRRIIGDIAKVLENLRYNYDKNSANILLHAERDLLLSTETLKTCVFNMTNNSFLLTQDPSATLGTLTLSKIDIPLKSGFKRIPNVYFVCVARCDITVLATKYVQPRTSNGEEHVTFDDELVFDNLEKSFIIYVKIYCIKLKFGNKMKIFKKKPKDNPIKIYYPDKDSDCIEPALKLCGEFEISVKNLQNRSVLNYFPVSPLSKTAMITRTISNLKMNTKKEGFMNFGQRHLEDQVIIWNTKYIVLKDSEMCVYDSPADVESKPIVTINLKNVASDVVAHSCHLKYCFQLDMVYEDSNFDGAFKFPYFLRANTWSDFTSWLHQLNYVINTLRTWHMLNFVDLDQ